MKRWLLILLVASIANAHVPVVTPSRVPHGDRPPKLERNPLPPVIFQDPIMQIPIILIP